MMVFIPAAIKHICERSSIFYRIVTRKGNCCIKYVVYRKHKTHPFPDKISHNSIIRFVNAELFIWTEKIAKFTPERDVAVP